MFKKLIQTITALSLLAFTFVIPAQAQATQNIVEIAVDTPQVSTLVAAVTAADLVDTLSGPGPFTVFAPTNDAFAALGSTLDVLLLPENNQLLTDILTYHVLSGSVDSATALTLTEATTVQGDTIALANQGGNLVLNGSTNVTTADIEATNGVIHLIDQVLLSESLAQRVTAAVEANQAANQANNLVAAPTPAVPTIRSGGSSLALYGVVAVGLLIAGFATLFASKKA